MISLSKLSDAVTRSISPENRTGEPGRGGMATEGFGAKAARDLGQGWKVSPAVTIRVWMMSLPWHFGIRRCLRHRFQHCRIAMI